MKYWIAQQIALAGLPPPSLADEVSVEDYFRQLVKLGIFTETEIRYELEEDF